MRTPVPHVDASSGERRYHDSTFTMELYTLILTEYSTSRSITSLFFKITLDLQVIVKYGAGTVRDQRLPGCVLRFGHPAKPCVQCCLNAGVWIKDNQ